MTESIYKSPAGEQAIMALYDSVLARWPVPHQALTVPTRYGDTFVLASGETSAPPLVLLHGAATNSAMWGADVPEYSRHYRVYAVDVIGEPGKSAPSRPAWQGPAYADWLADVLDGLVVDGAVLEGLSQGGWIALKFATTYPERVEKLVLLAPAGVTPDKASFLLRAILLMLLGPWGGRQLNRIVLGDQPVHPEVERFMNLVMAHFKSRMDPVPLFGDEELRRLSMPVLLMGGTRDAIRDVGKIAARLRAFVPHLTTILLPDAGHALHDVTSHVMPFLASADPV